MKRNRSIQPECSNRKEMISATMNTETTEQKMQFILDENGQLQEISKDQCRPVEYPIKCKRKNAFEVFVRVDGTENYWISNYGRGVNNHRSANKFYRHREGKCHYTVFEIEKQMLSYPILKSKSAQKKPDKKHERQEMVFPKNTSDEACQKCIEEKEKENPKRIYTLVKVKYKRETSPEKLVVDAFLVKYRGRNKVWHKDGDESNNWYKNLLTVSLQDYRDLKAGKITWQALNLEQEYIEYENQASTQLSGIYHGIMQRCGDTKDNNRIGKCYDNTTMCQEWLDNPKSFMKWYLEHYYECGDEPMHIDKDLFGDGSMYHPDFCCILPQRLNNLLTNCKKPYKEGQTPDNVLPLGIKYNKHTGKYYGVICFASIQKKVQLSEWDTAEEAFEEYKVVKQADILMMAAMYKESIPNYIYEKLLEVEVKPY